ncbi:3-oxoacyl-[acyl-carrier-protein] reductase [Entomobacter blattae]|uniref:3-oxoacyl-[acyl-carrier-protein] reductase n=1 Tax=Entomobacter blattae TaxID=2762277 RepID=A0A7H1NPB6_9PROT|nr:3-oxoacyl-[acyl-carrier-protein] reductase [Entomobacter blattae]QNT77626.1 3-oxoacyl-[acyl-carrier-protein] reductase FabG [Entomobacter blattae]
MFRLDGKLALVTGASGGIGAELARKLHAQGAEVVLSGSRQEVLAEIAASIGSERVHSLVADLSDKAAVETLIADAERLAHGRPLDILVNNAGITRDTLAIRMKDEDWAKVLEMDLSIPFYLSRSALKGMLKRRSGRIINIASIIGMTGNAGQANYAAAKAGMIGMSKSLAKEAGSRGVTVNVVAPGFIDTAMTQNLPEEYKKQLEVSIPLAKIGKPKDVAAAVVYLASEEAAWVTGSTLHVNGGMGMF